MRRGPEDLTYRATAGCVLFVTGVALTLIIHELLTLVGFLSSPSAQQLVGFGN